MLCKCDLVTDLVVEFPELQGLVGSEYAREKGETGRSCLMQFLNTIFQDLPETYCLDTDTGAILSIADKFDTICRNVSDRQYSFRFRRSLCAKKKSFRNSAYFLERVLILIL